MASIYATSMKHNAQYAMMQNRMNMINMLGYQPTFGGNMAALAAMDRQFAINNIQNETMYMIACAQEKSARNMLKKEFENNKLSYIA